MVLVIEDLDGGTSADLVLVAAVRGDLHLVGLGNHDIVALQAVDVDVSSVKEIYFVILISILGHFYKSYQKQHRQNNESDSEIRSYQYGKIAFLDGLKLTVVQ